MILDRQGEILFVLRMKKSASISRLFPVSSENLRDKPSHQSSHESVRN